jgi:2-polyprenyl-3-methyl-5-hydroxy-6-metoxy-1,4-benzoquinol methylase
MRDHDKEFQDNTERKYAYDFDDVVRSYLMRSLSPYFHASGKSLEIGCFDGGSTLRLAEHFDDLSVLEASSDLVDTARSRVPKSIRFIHGTIEDTELEPHYDAIFLVHTLEHLDDPVACLSRIRGWLSAEGRLYVVVPNAQAASRQIAVRMGLIETNHAVTEGERQHGHRCTYSMDTLENDARKAGLRIEARGGVMFKPFANFQFDAMITHGIIDQAYLDGCYALGMQYPDLTASIYLICRRD